MYCARMMDAELLAWANDAARKPLVLRGARQVGKTAAVRHLGSSFELFLELNLDRFEDRRLVDAAQSVPDLLAALRVRANVIKFPPQTLLFIDEIQESATAMKWLRFFQEDHPELAVVAAGSLLELRMQERGFSFPVGRVTLRYLRPFSLFEFMAACGHGVLAEMVRGSVATMAALPRPAHDQTLDLLRDYLHVGGMPEAVASWVQARSAVAVRQIQTDLLQAFAEDLVKYQRPADRGYLEAAFDHLRHHYGLRFKHENFAPGFRSEVTKSALARLEGAMVVRRVWPTSSCVVPLQTRARAAPKLLPLDIGLALSAMGVPISDLIRQALDSLLDGRVAEMFVGQELLTNEIRSDAPLHFWVTESSTANAELDYMVCAADGVRPVEVKSGASGSLKSLHQFLGRSGTQNGYRLYAGELAEQRHQVRVSGQVVDMRLVSLPLYCASLVGSVP